MSDSFVTIDMYDRRGDTRKRRSKWWRRSRRRHFRGSWIFGMLVATHIEHDDYPAPNGVSAFHAARARTLTKRYSLEQLDAMVDDAELLRVEREMHHEVFRRWP